MSNLQPVADSVLARMAVQGHDEATTILVPELKRDIPHVQTAFDEHRRARVTQLVKVDRPVAASHPPGADVAPEVREGALREAVTANSVQQVRRADRLRHERDRLGRDRRQDDPPGQTILGSLLAAGAVEAAL